MNRTYIFLLLLVLGLLGCNADPAPQVTTSNAVEANDPLAKLTQAVENDPDNADLRYKLGVMLYEREGYETAIEQTQAAIAIDSLRPEFHHLLADCYLDYYQSRKALSTMEHAAYLFPTNVPTLLKLSEFQLILERHQQALATLSKIRVVDKTHPEMFFMLGVVLQDMGELDGAIDAFQSSVEQNAENVDAWVSLGRLMQNRDPSVAERYFKNALQLAPKDANVRHHFASFLTEQKRFDEAIAVYREIIISDPQYVDAYYNAGILLLEQDSIEQAYKNFDLATRVDPAFAKAYYYRGVASFNLGHNEAAKKDFQHAINLDENLEMAYRALENVQ